MECGECTVCCRDLKIPEVDSIQGQLCKHCDWGVGCKIYEQRPESCRIFECCWKQMKVVPIALRPDKCGVLFEKYSDKVIVGSTVDDLSDLIKGQIAFFNKEGISVVIINMIKKHRYFCLANGHTVESVEEEIRWRHRHTQKI